MSVAKQVAIIYAGTNGFLDDIDVKGVRPFELALDDALDSSYADWVRLFDKEQAMTDDVKEGLESLLTDFKAKFKN